MQSTPTLLHVRMSSTSARLNGASVPMVLLIERMGNGWGKSRINAYCLFDGAAQWVARLKVGDSLQAELCDLQAQGGIMHCTIKAEPVLLTKALSHKREQLQDKEHHASA